MSRKVTQARALITGNGSPDSATARTDNAALVALAYELWLGRGCPIGSPEVDWFRAEELLTSRAESPVERVLSLAATSGS